MKENSTQINALRIVIIDDDRIFQFLISKILESINPQIKLHSFENGEVAVEFMKQQSSPDFADVIFLDINMPVRNGWGVLHWIEEHYKSSDKIPKIYIISSSIDPSDLKRSEENSLIEDYLVKPISKSKLEKVFSDLSSAK